MKRRPTMLLFLLGCLSLQMAFVSCLLSLGQTLVKNTQTGKDSFLESADTFSLAVFQSDGNLVVYDEYNDAVWSTETNLGTVLAQGQLVFAPDGELYIKTAAGLKLWSTGTNGLFGPDYCAGNELSVGDDAVLNIKNSSGVVCWSSTLYPTVSRLFPTTYLSTDRWLESASRQHRFYVQQDGNLVFQVNGNPVWSTGTDGNTNPYLAIQSDGNLVLYNSNGSAPLWSTSTSGINNYVKMKDDGNVVVLTSNGGTVKWALYDNPKNGILYPNFRLVAGYEIFSSTRNYKATISSAGAFEIYDVTKTTPVYRWETFQSGSYLLMNANGRLQLVNSSGNLIVNATGSCPAGSMAFMQDDGNFVVNNPDGTTPCWATGSCASC